MFMIPGKRFGNEYNALSAQGPGGVAGPVMKPKPQVIPKPLPLGNNPFPGVDWKALGGGLNQGSPGMRPRPQARPMIPTRRPGSRPSTRRVPQGQPAPQPAPPLQARPPVGPGDLLPQGPAVPPGGGINPNASDTSAPMGGMTGAPTPQPGGINPNANDQSAPMKPAGTLDYAMLEQLLKGLI